MASPAGNEYPNGPCPPEEQIKTHIRTIFKEVGPHALTMKILRLRLSSIYKIDFKEHTPSLSNWVQEVIKEPNTEALLNDAHSESQKKVKTTRKSKSTTKRERKTDDAGAADSKQSKKKHRAEGEPKRGQTSFFLWSSENRAAVTEEVKAGNGGKSDLGAVGKRLGELWGQVDAETKAKYEALAVKDKERYQTEMDAFLAGGGVKGVAVGKKGKKEKDPNAPKKPQTAYFAYMGEVAPALREKSKAGNDGKVDIAAVGKEVGALWNALSADEKKKYEDIAAVDRKRYEKECEEKGYPYKKSGGGASPGKDAAAGGASSGDDDE